MILSLDDDLLMFAHLFVGDVGCDASDTDFEAIQNSIASESSPTVFQTCKPTIREHSRNKAAFQLPAQPAQYYANKVTIALNSYDYVNLFEQMRSFCTPDVKIMMRVYSLTSPNSAEMGLQDREFHHLEQFCYFMEVWNCFVPDGVFESSSHRVCVNSRPTYVFISNLRFHGHKIVRDINLLDGDLLQLYSYLPQILVNQVVRHNGCVSMIDIRGSISTFINDEGMIDRIEFYFCLP